MRGISKLALVAVIAAGCTDAVSAGPEFDSEVVTPGALGNPNPSQQYRHTSANVRADSLLPIIFISGLRFSEAWEPISDECEPPVEPRLTLVVTAGAGSAASFGFEPGNGIEPCTLSVRRYRPAN